jgi:hypothetical protein
MEIKSRKRVKAAMREEEEEGMKGRRRCIFFRAKTFGPVGGRGVHVQGHAADAGKQCKLKKKDILGSRFCPYFFSEFEVESGVV